MPQPSVRNGDGKRILILYKKKLYLSYKVLMSNIDNFNYLSSSVNLGSWSLYLSKSLFL